MKNKYEIRGDHAVIFIRRHKDEPMELLIDLQDLERAKEYRGTWGLDTCSYKDYTCAGSYFHNGVHAPRTYLHRWILQPADSEVVSFQTDDYLDCRRNNLRITSRSELFLKKVRAKGGKPRA